MSPIIRARKRKVFLRKVIIPGLRDGVVLGLLIMVWFVIATA